MRKTILLTLFLLLFAVPALAGTLAAVGTPSAENIVAITAVDNTTVYLATDKGKVYSQNISTGARTLLATIRTEGLKAITTNGTFCYVGTNKGKVIPVTIADGTIGAATCTIPRASVRGVKYDATLSLIWVVSNRNQTYTCTP